MENIIQSSDLKLNHTGVNESTVPTEWYHPFLSWFIITMNYTDIAPIKTL